MNHQRGTGGAGERVWLTGVERDRGRARLQQEGTVVLHGQVAEIASVAVGAVRRAVHVPGRVEVTTGGAECGIGLRVADTGLMDVQAVLARRDAAVGRIGDSNQDFGCR